MIIRDATDAEREQLRTILADSYCEAFQHSAGAPPDEARFLADAGPGSLLAAPIAYPWLLRVAAGSGGRLLGALAGSIAKQTRLVTVMHLWIEPSGDDADGIGPRLLADLEAFAITEGALRIQFMVLLSDDRVRRACESAGYAARSVGLTMRLQPPA